VIFKTRYQRSAAACEILRDLSLRATNPIIKESCDIAEALISAPLEVRRRIEPRAIELVAAAKERRERLAKVPA
jgi:hypothetical protein